MSTKRLTLKGSCHCGRVKFAVKSSNYYPYQLCYCSICRKTQGGGGFAINLSADAKSLKIQGKTYLKIYRAKVKNPGEKSYISSGERNFCQECGSALWLYDPTWPELIHPFASAIDSPLPLPPQKTHLMLEFKASWIRPDISKGDLKFKRYPKESISQWHERHF